MDLQSDPTLPTPSQDELYRQKVMRARAMTESERLDETFRLTQEMFNQMHKECMKELELTDPGAGWDEVGRRIREQRAKDEGFFLPVSEPEAWKQRRQATPQ
jgi:hypothetical protein